MDPGFLDTAMQRSFETALYWSHTRPNGLDCFTANNKIMGENIAAGAPTPESVMDMWMNSDGHGEYTFFRIYQAWRWLSICMNAVTTGCSALD